MMSKLKRKANYKEQQNVVQDFYEIHKLQWYMLGEIAKSKTLSPLESKKLDKKTKEAYDTKLF